MLSIAVIIPCLNEENSIGSVIDKWKKEVPEAQIFVCDNDSEDQTLLKALDHGANVVVERTHGKGAAVKTLLGLTSNFKYIILSDGDGEITPTREIIEPVLEGNADIVCGDRLGSGSYFKHSPNPLKSFANKLMPWISKHTLGVSANDPLCGLKAFKREFTKGLELSDNFEIEIEMLNHAVKYNYKLEFVPVEYTARKSSKSKIHFFRDGFKIVIKCIKFKFAK